jgi:hypothetical protein
MMRWQEVDAPDDFAALVVAAYRSDLYREAASLAASATGTIAVSDPTPCPPE